MPLATESGYSLVLSLEPRATPASGELYSKISNQVFVDQVRGKELGLRHYDRPATSVNAEIFVVGELSNSFALWFGVKTGCCGENDYHL